MKKMPNNYIVIGAGGIGGYLAPLLKRHLRNTGASITIIDGDRIEIGNLTRQNFLDEELGRYKASALAMRIGCQFDNRFIDDDFTLSKPTVVFCCVDNHPARLAAITAVDEQPDSVLFIAANEYKDTQVSMYISEWKGTNADYRARYPNVMTDKSGSRVVHCDSEEALSSFPQLALFNNLSAAQALTLYFNLSHCLTHDVPIGLVPYEVACNGGGFYTQRRLG